MTGKEEFAARLARIQSGQGNQLGTIHIGSHEEDLPRRGRAAASPKGEIARNALYPLSLLAAMALGGLSIALGRYARFHLFHHGNDVPDPDVELAINMGIGLMVSFVLGQALRLTSKEHRTLQAAGVFVMIGLFHNLGHWLPGPMARAFSPDYVAELAATPPNTFYFRGAYFPLFDQSTPEAPAADPEAEAPCPKAPEVTILQTDHAKKRPKASAKHVETQAAETTCAP